ncbi:MAG: glyoxalase [Suipraeoptans sp.]
MSEYSESFTEEILKTFIRNQEQLFDDPVAETLEEAEAFLEDCMAVVVDSLEEVREYFEEEGLDVDHMSLDELEEASEVFKMPDGQYLIVEG